MVCAVHSMMHVVLCVYGVVYVVYGVCYVWCGVLCSVCGSMCILCLMYFMCVYVCSVMCVWWVVCGV